MMAGEADADVDRAPFAFQRLVPLLGYGGELGAEIGDGCVLRR